MSQPPAWTRHQETRVDSHPGGREGEGHHPHNALHGGSRHLGQQNRDFVQGRAPLHWHQRKAQVQFWLGIQAHCAAEQGQDPNRPHSAAEIISKLNPLIGYTPIDQSHDTVTYSLNMTDSSAARAVLESVEKAKADLGIQGLMLNLSTLEEVFLNVARGQAGAHVLSSAGVLEAE